MRSAHCRVTKAPIDTVTLLASVAAPSDGAVLLFLGIVRDHNEGAAVAHLEYEAYAAMAEAVLREILAEAQGRWAVGEIAVEHRTGRLEIGEVSVAVAVAAPHRDAAYAASRYVIDELKRRAPIWKQEAYVDGERVWLDGAVPAAGQGR
jgi:molybdopterin synthase catalytic subunit